MKRAAAQIPSGIDNERLRDAAERLVRLYESWNKPDEAANWRRELDAIPSFDPSTIVGDPRAGIDAAGFDER